MDAPVRSVPRKVWRESGVTDGPRAVPQETAVALTYNGGTHAVMMATPSNLQDFAVGFSLAEGVVQSPDDIQTLDIVDLDGGVELRMRLPQANEERLRERRRQIAGPTGCGLCGVDSIQAALKPAAIVSAGRAFSPQQIMAAMQAVAPLQVINIETRAVHAAAFWTATRGIICLREDVGRHNALDKLAGALAREKISASDGIVLLTSRVSVEMVQKSAAMNAAVIVSVSAPTALAVRMAEAAGVTLVAIARADGFEVFTHPHRILNERARLRRRMTMERAMSPDRLIHMANQIGTFFRSQGADKAVPGIADHIRKFWDPRMRKAITAHLDAGGEGLDPPVREAIASLKG